MMTQKPPRILAIFDVDGTLLKNARAVRDVFLQAFTEISGLDSDIPMLNFAGNTDRRIVRSMLEESGAGDRFDEIFPEWEKRFAQLLEESYREHPDPYLLPGVFELLQNLENNPEVALAVGTGNCRETCRIKLERFGLNRFFPVGGFGGDYEDRVDMVLAAVREAESYYGWSGEAWVIGDTVRDIVAARGAGTKVLAVATGFTPRAELEEAGADMVLDNLTDTEGFYRALGLQAT